MPALPAADRASPRPFGLVSASGKDLSSASSTRDERLTRRLPPLRLGTTSSPADADVASSSDTLRRATDQIGRAVVLWARRRSPTWSACLPMFVSGMSSDAGPGGAKRGWRLVGAAALAGVLAGVFLSVAPGNLAYRAAAWAVLVLPSSAFDNGAEPAQVADASDDVVAVVRPVPADALAPRMSETAATLPATDAVPAAEAPPGGNADAQVGDDDATAVEWQHLYRLGHEFQGKGDLEAAAEMFRLAARLNPAHGALLYDWGYLLQTQGKDEAAIEKYREAVKLDPTHPYAHYNLGYLLQRQGNDAAALAAYREAARSHPDNPFLQYNWGMVLERLGKDQEAARRYRRAIEVAPEAQPAKDAQQRLAALGVEG